MIYMALRLNLTKINWMTKQIFSEAVDNVNWDEVNLTLILITVVLVRMNMCILILTHYNIIIFFNLNLNFFNVKVVPV